MSLRNNRAVRTNRNMMFGIIFLGLVIIGCVFAFLYMSYQPQAQPGGADGTDGLAQDSDSIVYVIDDAIPDSITTQ